MIWIYKKMPFNIFKVLMVKATEAEIRNFLGGFNFRDNKAKDSIKHFSGGEKA